MSLRKKSQQSLIGDFSVSGSSVNGEITANSKTYANEDGTKTSIVEINSKLQGVAFFEVIFEEIGDNSAKIISAKQIEFDENNNNPWLKASW